VSETIYLLPERCGRRKYKVGSMEVTFDRDTERISKWQCVEVSNGFARFEPYKEAT
jgi:hypothetical protein